MRINSLDFSVFRPQTPCGRDTPQDLNISITNLTQGLHFTPLIVAAHNGDASIFSVATTASSELQMMLEAVMYLDSDRLLDTMLIAASADIKTNLAGGLLAPAGNTETMLTTTDGNMYLSITAMMLPTNDGFVGLDNRVHRWLNPVAKVTVTVQ
jgi:hypothetical protein